MYVVVLKDFSCFEAWEVLKPCKMYEKFFVNPSGKYREHIDVINALPEYYCKVAESGEEVIKERNCSCMKTIIAIDPANDSDEWCCILAVNEWNAMRILECVPLHACRCQNMFTEKNIDDRTRKNSLVIPNHDYYMIRKFLKDNDLLLD